MVPSPLDAKVWTRRYRFRNETVTARAIQEPDAFGWSILTNTKDQVRLGHPHLNVVVMQIRV